MVESVTIAPHGVHADQRNSGQSAASWAAIFAGAFVAVSVSLVLITLGSGIGLASISPWPSHGVSATRFTISAIIWLIVTQWLSAAIGGYIAGRLRRKWIGTHTHEVFFRDTAHGLVTWSVATVFSVSVLTASLAGTGAHVASDVASAGIKAGSTNVSGSSYDVDKLFRRADSGSASQSGHDPRPEVGGIIANAATSGGVRDADRSYLSQLVASQTGLSQTDAQKRVDDFIASANDSEQKVKAAADAARKAAAQLSIYIALSLLGGAFIASVSAALGGRLRDEHP
jgi:hypothetical protein